jgi:hypothetical protein
MSHGFKARCPREPTTPEDRGLQARAVRLRELGQHIQEELRTFASAAADGG